jgi:transposase
MDGKAVKEVRTFATTTADLISLSVWLAENKCTHIAMEATGVYWKPVWHILSDGDFELLLANAAHIKNVSGRKTDVKGADWISDLLAHGLIRPSFVPDGPTQEMRTLLRTRKQLSREKASHIYSAAARSAHRQTEAAQGVARDVTIPVADQIALAMPGGLPKATSG